MFELIRKIVKDSPLEVKYSKTLNNFTVLYKNIAILYVGDEQECKEFVRGYEQHISGINFQFDRLN